MEKLILKTSTAQSPLGDLLDMSGSSSVSVLGQADVLGVSKGGVYVQAATDQELAALFDGVQCITDTSIAQIPVALDACSVTDQLMGVDTDDVSLDQPAPTLFEAGYRLSSVSADIQKALSGELSGAELQVLVDQIQADLLDFLAQTSDVFGELGQEVTAATSQLELLDNSELFASINSAQADLIAVGQDVQASSLASEATLDALFASPDHIPLTMDFSDSAHVESVAELFSNEFSSISTGADDGSNGGGFDPDSNLG